MSDLEPQKEVITIIGNSDLRWFLKAYKPGSKFTLKVLYIPFPGMDFQTIDFTGESDDAVKFETLKAQFSH